MFESSSEIKGGKLLDLGKLSSFDFLFFSINEGNKEKSSS